MVFKIVPMLNVDGVIMGNHRCNLAGHDLNRQHSNPSISQSPSIYYLKQMIAKLSASSRDVLLFCDLHAHSRTHCSSTRAFEFYVCSFRDSLTGDT